MGQITLIFLLSALILPNFSLLIFIGNLTKSRYGTAAFRTETASKRREIAKYPVNFPVTRELPMETGSYPTAHTTIQSSQTADFRADVKQADSVGVQPISFCPFGLW